MKNLVIFILLATAAWCQQQAIDVVASYGADPTGSNDSTSALNNAFANSSNATRYIPAGIYKISSTLTIDPRYKVLGAPGFSSASRAGTTTIWAVTGFSGPMANVIATSAQTSVIGGGMDGLFFDCGRHASVGILYGGSATSTVYGYMTSNTVAHNCTTAGAQVGQNSWLLSWFNVGFQGNGGDGLQVLDQINMGENLNCHACDISNNGGNGVTLGPATHGFTHHFNCIACSFNYNAAWGIQNQTATSGESIVTVVGGQIETAGATQKWVQNFGRMTLDGVVTIDDRGSGPRYLIDNENYFDANGGRFIQGPATSIMNPGQTGFTSCLAAIGLQAMCSQFIDPTGGTNGFPNTHFSGYVSVSGATPTMSGSTVGFGNTTGFGNGAAGTNVTTTPKNTGSGPATPQTVVKYIEIDIGGAKYWIPLMR
jgi:hypothetical protein